MSSPARIMGHPIHPILVTLPIGLWIFSLVSDVIFLMHWGAPIWNDVAFYTMAGGVVGALLAALPGLVDLLSIEDRTVKTLGLSHMIINLLVVALFAGNVWLRMTAAPDAMLPVSLSVVGILLLGISGWLGGEMVYVHGVGVEPRGDSRREERDRIRSS